MAGGAVTTGGNIVATAANVAATTTTIKAPPFKIEQLHESQLWLKLLVYGGYGTGKTRLAGTSALVPDMRDILMIDAEAGGLTIATDGNIESEEAAKQSIDRVRVSTFKEFSRVQEFLKLHCKYRDENNEDKLRELEIKLRGDYDESRSLRRYSTVIIDSLSEIEAFSLYQLLGITDRTAIDEEVATAEWAEYKKNNSQILRAIRAYRDLPMNVIITSAVQDRQDEKKRLIYAPALTGKLSKQVQGFMDMVGFLTIHGSGDEEVRRMYVQPGSQYDAKNRFSSYRERYFDDPTIGTILRAVGLRKTSKA